MIQQQLDNKISDCSNKVDTYEFLIDEVKKKHDSLCESLVRQEVMVTEVALKLD